MACKHLSLPDKGLVRTSYFPHVNDIPFFRGPSANHGVYFGYFYVAAAKTYLDQIWSLAQGEIYKLYYTCWDIGYAKMGILRYPVNFYSPS